MGRGDRQERLTAVSSQNDGLPLLNQRGTPSRPPRCPTDRRATSIRARTCSRCSSMHLGSPRRLFPGNPSEWSWSSRDLPRCSLALDPTQWRYRPPRSSLLGSGLSGCLDRSPAVRCRALYWSWRRWSASLGPFQTKDAVWWGTPANAGNSRQGRTTEGAAPTSRLRYLRKPCWMSLCACTRAPKLIV